MLLPTTRKELIDLLQDYSDVFAWSYQDMPGLDTDIVVHRLPFREKCAPIKQSENQRGSKEATRCEIPRSIHVSPMGGQHSASTKESWQSTDVCRLSGFEQSKPKG